MVEWLILSTFASRKKQQQKLLLLRAAVAVSLFLLLILKLLEIKVAERHSHISSLAQAPSHARAGNIAVRERKSSREVVRM